jgi:FKBP-type peptidyl-prolyl cis-trans isomerase
VQVLAQGTGPAAQPGDTVLFDYVLRRANGYFIYATVEGASFQPKDVPVGPVSFRLGAEGGLIPGLSEVLAGMSPGGRVRALVPPELGYVAAAVGAGAGQPLGPQPPTFATKRQLANHQTEPLLFEVELLRVNEARR